MNKRRRSCSGLAGPAAKRPRLFQDQLSNLSDELLLRVLSELPVQDLTVCQRVSKRLNTVAADAELWKAAYYDRFVRPRTHRMLRAGSRAANPGRPSSSTKLSKWLDEDGLVRGGRSTNWKRQYKIRHNWAKGSCGLGQIPVATRLPTPPLLARLHNGVVYTVDSNCGLRAWSYKVEGKLLARKHLSSTGDSNQAARPTSLAVESCDVVSGDSSILVGFDNGSFQAYAFTSHESSFRHLYTHTPVSPEPISAISSAWPYILAMTESQTLSLYRVSSDPRIDSNQQAQAPPQLISSLQSNSVRSPMSLSVRLKDTQILASIAYSFPTYHNGWSVGVQELRFSENGDVLDSRLASAVNEGFHSLSGNHPAVPARDPASVLSSGAFPLRRDHIRSMATSLSYSHPYLLASHSDNTLTLYLVTSTRSHLHIAAGRRLWGHTSSVLGAQVGGRGRAVSVSARGDEVRLWELETTASLSSRSERGRISQGETSVKLTPERKSWTTLSPLDDVVSRAVALRGDGLGLALDGQAEDMDTTKGWVGFDDENVIVLRQQRQGPQALMVYDFTC